MNKTELIAAIAAKAEMTKVDAAKAFNALLAVTKEEMKKKDGKISIIGFGTFSKQHRAKRNGEKPADRQEDCHPCKGCHEIQSQQGFLI